MYTTAFLDLPPLLTAGGTLRLPGSKSISNRVLLLAGLPSFIAEAKFSGDAFRLFRWRSPETRMQMYLETVIAREDHAKEVKLFGLGPLLLQRYWDLWERHPQRDDPLTKPLSWRHRSDDIPF